MTLYLGFPMDHHDNLRKGMHQFCLVHNTTETWNILKSRLEKNQVIAGGGEGGKP